MLHQCIAWLAGSAHLLALILIPFGDKLFSVLGVPQPPMYTQIVAPNRLVCFGAIFMANSWAQSLVATGAFEVSVNDEVAFSKLQTGRMPELAEINNILRAALAA